MIRQVFTSLLVLSPWAAAQATDATAKLLQEIIRIDTSNPPGNEAKMAAFLKAKFEPLGFQIDVIATPDPAKAHFIARLKGDGSKKPILLAAHADVVGIGYVQGFGAFNINIPRNTIGFWIQDDWKITSRLTLNLGLRYDNDIGIFDPSLRLKSGIVTPRSGDNLNFAPRLGFAYDVTNNRKTVIRGGAGLYYADIQANQVIDQQIFNGQQSLQASVCQRRPPQPSISTIRSEAPRVINS